MNIANIGIRGGPTVFTCLALLLTSCTVFNRYARMPDAAIQTEFSRDVPLGSSPEMVCAYLHRKTGREHHLSSTNADSPQRGDYYIAAKLAECNHGPRGLFLMSTVVTSTWWFDQNRRLDGIQVGRYLYGP